MNSKRQCDLFGHTASYINTSLLRLAIKVGAFFVITVYQAYGFLLSVKPKI